MGGVYTATEGFQRLRGGDPVLLAEDACLIVRRPAMSCRLCKEACPAGVLSGNQWTVALEAEGCIACGLCAAACPTGAISVEGFAVADRVPRTEPARWTVECRRVPSTQRSDDAIIVPCLGGLTVPDLLDLSAKTTAVIALQDRGWCNECPVGGCSDPWQANLDNTKSILDQVDPRRAASLVVDEVSIPIEEAEPVADSLRSDKQLNRRIFFRQLAGLSPAHDAKESKRIVFERGAVRPIQRQRVLATIGSLAGDLGIPVPAGLMPVMEIGDACELHGICAAICPTEALQKVAFDDGTLAIQFDAQSCIACGECQRACPSKALSLWPEGGQQIRDYPVTLMSRQSKTCNGCGAAFVSARGSTDDLCTVCNRSIDVMRNMSDFLSGRQLTS